LSRVDAGDHRAATAKLACHLHDRFVPAVVAGQKKHDSLHLALRAVERDILEPAVRHAFLRRQWLADHDQCHEQ
jgi:hypothetical protein